jgi:hypothetical protein
MRSKKQSDVKKGVPISIYKPHGTQVAHRTSKQPLLTFKNLTHHDSKACVSQRKRNRCQVSLEMRREVASRGSDTYKPGAS